jgi:hypothetical protein
MLAVLLVPKKEQFDGEGKHQGGVLLRGDLDNGFQQPQLKRGRVHGHHLGRLGQFFRRLQFTVGGDNPSPPLTLRSQFACFGEQTASGPGVRHTRVGRRS